MGRDDEGGIPARRSGQGVLPAEGGLRGRVRMGHTGLRHRGAHAGRGGGHTGLQGGPSGAAVAVPGHRAGDPHAGGGAVLGRGGSPAGDAHGEGPEAAPPSPHARPVHESPSRSVNGPEKFFLKKKRKIFDMDAACP